jgi:hypothetical protein
LVVKNKMSLSSIREWTYTVGVEAQTEPVIVGCKVEIDLIGRDGHKERLSVVIVPDESADFEHGYLGVNTPLGKALLGERAGHVIPYLRDDILAIEILQVTKEAQLPSQDIAKRRADEMKKTLKEVQNTNAMLFASSFSGKWGDYDPDSIPQGDESRDPDQD